MGCQKAYSQSDLELLEELAIREARRDYWAYLQYMNPGMKLGWWQKHASGRLMEWFDDFVAGKRPMLVFEAPPQHGKSYLIVLFLSWLAGKFPDKKQIYASFSDDLGVRANGDMQRLIDSDRYKKVFPGTSINSDNVVTVSTKPKRNSSLLEFVGQTGSFTNTTVMGQITGKAMHIGAVDDPLKGREAANSETIRNKTWNWMTDDFFSRMDEAAGLLFILTRWHVDDPIGRLRQEFGDRIEMLKYPALAEPDALLMEDDPRGHGSGEALFPEHKSREFLLEQKSIRTDASWQSLYQQNPYVRGGGMFPVDRFQVIDRRPMPSEIEATARYWDKAGTAGGGAYTAGVLMDRLKDGRFVISDVVRGQWSAMDREARIKQTANIDGKNVKIFIEQEPGSGGKESAESTVRNLAGFNVLLDRVTGDKETRADPYAAQVQGGNVMIVRGEWNRAFMDEHESFPNGTYKDQVDAAAGAFNKLACNEKPGPIGLKMRY